MNTEHDEKMMPNMVAGERFVPLQKLPHFRHKILTSLPVLIVTCKT